MTGRRKPEKEGIFKQVLYKLENTWEMGEQ